MERFSQLLHSIPDITYRTQWKEAQTLYMEPHLDLKQEFQGMDMLDFLSVFEEYNRTLWEEPMADLAKLVNQRRRRERKAREGYKTLMQELVDNYTINVRTKWKDIYPLIKDDPRYFEAVGLADSTPLDMFWDVIDDLDEQLYQQKKLVYDALKRANVDITLETSIEEYMSVLDETVTSEVNQENLKLQPHIQLENTWEDVKPMIETMEEYIELNDSTLAQEAFENVSDGEERKSRRQKISGYGSSTEEGEALDAYVKKRM
ncbi:hypothetical protein CU098_000390 [Rhizopus stolonifer]|uniref:FF domain-containing protein n=1 Tax=Rhizopus stolonifer TaxID=4846 RepID=A0A367KTB7_RHIST|nr:hypothetical protein CU098_000390 [Rhizopus stolonifer]